MIITVIVTSNAIIASTILMSYTPTALRKYC